MRLPLLPAALLAAAPLAAQAPVQLDPPPPPTADSVTVVAGARYRAGTLHRWLFGDGYRELWTTPARVPVLDLGRVAGGLRPTEVGGGMQTTSLRLESADGREFVFRSVDKDPSDVLPPKFRDSPARAVVQDQISASHPAGALVVAPLVDALGLLHTHPRLAVMPDDPRLGEFRERFAGMFGLFEEYPDERPGDRPGFAGSSKVVGTHELFERLNAGSEDRVVAEEFLAARFLDFIVNDWDRHADQWRWVRVEGDGVDRWRPVPRDRDQALIWFGGAMLGLARIVAPRLVAFERSPDVRGLTINSRLLDARLLAGLERRVWDSVVAVVRTRLTDSVIHAAVRRMPAAWYQRSGPRIAATLEARRDRLPRAAGRFYRMLAKVVDVHATDAGDRALVERLPDGSVRVRLSGGREDGEGPVYFDRRFCPDETAAVRVYLHGGDDSAQVVGRVERSIVVRIIGGNGVNRLADSSEVNGIGRPTPLYDQGPRYGVTYGPDTLPDRRPWIGRDGGPDRPPPPDHGGALAPSLGVRYHSGPGLVTELGAGLVRYGFQRDPWASRLGVELGWAFDAGAVAAALEMEAYPRASSLSVTGRVSVDGYRRIRWYGRGNETPAGPQVFHEVDQTRYTMELSLGRWLRPGLEVFAGPRLRLDRSGTAGGILAAERPYGVGELATAAFEAGGALTLPADPDDDRVLGLRVNGAVVPAWLDARETYGSLRAEASGHVRLPLSFRPVVAARVGGERVWGAHPFFDAAYLGGARTLRGFDPQRFAGESAVWTGLELRVPLFDVDLILPFELGVLGFVDAGRVWADGEESDRWHAAPGGGVWMALPESSSVLTIQVADGPDLTGVYIGTGLEL